MTTLVIILIPSLVSALWLLFFEDHSTGVWRIQFWGFMGMAVNCFVGMAVINVIRIANEIKVRK